MKEFTRASGDSGRCPKRRPDKVRLSRSRRRDLPREAPFAQLPYSSVQLLRLQEGLAPDFVQVRERHGGDDR